jgi:trans-aconitate methyltransferase
MIEHARRQFPSSRHPNLEFQLMDARAIRLPREYDVVFSNAALHWVDDHRAFLAGAGGVLRRGGRLRVSCGGRGNAEEVFRALRVVMRDPRWRKHFRGLRKPYFFYGPEDYFPWLEEALLRPEVVRLAEKEMVLADRAAFAGWVRTTWIPYTHRVPEEQREGFIHELVDRYLAKHPLDAKGQVRVRMVRLEMEARAVGE